MKLILILPFLPIILFGQSSNSHNGWSRSEIGLMGGATYYIGDLNHKHFKNNQLAGQIYYRYNVHSRFAIRGNFTYGAVKAADSESNEEVFQNRNLSFESKLYEFATGVEFTYLPFEIGNKKYWGTAYLLTQLGLTRINPTTSFNNQTIELQSIGTEGQGSSLSQRSKYSKTQLVVPIGAGVRISMGPSLAFNLEYGIRFLFTDYLDDVRNTEYISSSEIQSANGALAANLQNRSLDQNRFGIRGNSTGRDWYSFFGAGLSFRLGGKNKCPSPK